MTKQFDEGVKEVLASLILTAASLNVNTTDLERIAQKIEHGEHVPTKQAIDAVKQTTQASQKPVLIKVARRAISELETSRTTNKEKPSRSASSVEQNIYNRLIDGGLTPVAAIGIVANLKAESNLDPAMVQYRGGPGRGLAQWEKGGRFDTDRINLVKFAKKNNKPWTDFETQIDFILHELRVHPEYMKVKEKLNKAKSVEEATSIFLKDYEKAGVPHMEKRLNYAKELKEILNASEASCVKEC